MRSTFIRWTSCLLICTTTFGAEQISVELDPEKTKIRFVLDDVLHTVRGTFLLKEGRISIDLSNLTMAGAITVDAGSGRSGNVVRDRRMAHNILEVQRYPYVQFVPMKVSGPIQPTGASDVLVTGSFLVHGNAHEISFPVRIQMSAPNITATGKFYVPYVDWGMKNPSTFLLKVSDKVEIDLEAVGVVRGLAGR